MTTQLFVNLPAADLSRTKRFFEAIGWSINADFSDDNAACVVIDENAYLMMLTHDFFTTFTDKPIVDPASAIQVETAFTVESKEAVDAITEKALAAGGREPRPTQDLGFMYSRAFEDPDGNLFSPVWMDSSAAQDGPPVP